MTPDILKDFIAECESTMKPHQIAELSPETMALADKLNAACADAPIRKLAAHVAKAANWNKRTGGIEGIHLDCHAVRTLHAFLQHHLSLANTAMSHERSELAP